MYSHTEERTVTFYSNFSIIMSIVNTIVEIKFIVNSLVSRFQNC